MSSYRINSVEHQSVNRKRLTKVLNLTHLTQSYSRLYFKKDFRFFGLF